MSQNTDSCLARILVDTELPSDAVDRCFELCQNKQITDETVKGLTVDELEELGLPLSIAAYISRQYEKEKIRPVMSHDIDSFLKSLFVGAKLPQDAIDEYLKLCQDNLITDETVKALNKDQLKELGFTLPVADYISRQCELAKQEQYIPNDLRSNNDSKAKLILEELALYELRGQNCLNDEKEYIEKISDLFDKVYQYTTMPIVFLASSSGTGKTQLTFTLNQPLIYFTLADISDNDQNIYEAFKKQSSYLEGLLHKDKNNYDEQQRKIDYCQDLTPSKYSFSEMYDCKDFESQAAGFIVEFLKRTMDAKQRDAGLSWMRAQLECGSFHFQVKTIGQARSELGQIIAKCRKIWSKPPVVFLDETIEVNTPDFRFVRSLIRSIGLALVIMGTNTDVAEFVSKGSASRSGPGKPWCFLVHKLPPTSKSYLDQTYLRCENGVEPTIKAICNRIDKESSQNLRAFVDMLLDNLLKERPLIAINIAGRLVTFLKKILHDLESVKVDDSFIKDQIENFLEKTLSGVFADFVEQKKVSDTCVFREAQLDFFVPRPEEVSGSYVNKHIAYISIKGNTHDPHYVELRLKQKDKDKVSLFYYLNDRRGGTATFYGKSVMPSFEAQPLSCLCFSGSRETLDSLFASDDRYTALYANLEYQKGLEELKNRNANNLQERDKPLERIVELAAILASHAYGIRSNDGGASRKFLFRDMFPHFVRELQSKFGSQAPTVDFDNESQLWDMLDDQPIPYCATSGANWETGLFKFLTENLGCHLGTVYRDSDDLFDVKMFNGNLDTEKYAALRRKAKSQQQVNEIKQRMEREQNEKLVLLFEGKFNQTCINATVLSKKIANDNTNCKIIVVVGTDWSEFDTSENSELVQALELKKAWLLKLVTIDKEERSYGFKELYRVKGKINKVYILIQLKDSLSAKDFSDLLNECEKL